MRAIYASILVTGLLIGPAVFAKKLTHEETIKLLKSHSHVSCDLVKFTRTFNKEKQFNKNRQVLLEGGTPAPRGSSDNTAYFLKNESRSHSFSYVMNSQSGRIRVIDKMTGTKAEASLDLLDLAQSTVENADGDILIGTVRLTQRKSVEVRDPDTSQIVQATLENELEGECWRLTR